MNLADAPQGAEWILFWALFGPVCVGFLAIPGMMLKDTFGDLPRGLRWTETVLRAVLRGLRWVLLRAFYPERLEAREKPSEAREKVRLLELERIDREHREAWERSGGHPEWDDAREEWR